MKKITFFVCMVLLFGSFISTSCAQREEADETKKAPDFTLEDISGASVNLSDVLKANEATLLTFWTTWCPFCKEEIPELRRLHAEYKDKGLKLLALNIGEGKKKVELFVKQQGLEYDVLLDSDNMVATKYGVMGIPTNVLIDKEGNIKYRGTRPPPEELLPQK